MWRQRVARQKTFSERQLSDTQSRTIVRNQQNIPQTSPFPLVSPAAAHRRDRVPSPSGRWGSGCLYTPPPRVICPHAIWIPFPCITSAQVRDEWLSNSPRNKKKEEKKKKPPHTHTPPFLPEAASFNWGSTWLIYICEGQGTPAGEVKNGAAHVRGRLAHPGLLPDKRDCWKAIDSFWQRQGEKYFDHVTLYKLTSLLHVWNFYRRYKYHVCNRPQNPAHSPLLPGETSIASQPFCRLEIPQSSKTSVQNKSRKTEYNQLTATYTFPALFMTTKYRAPWSYLPRRSLPFCL